MAKYNDEIVEPEEKTNIEDVSWNPLDEPVNEKPYTSSGVSATAEDLSKPIGEPRFSPPPFKKPEQPKEKVKQEPINADLQNLSKKDAEMSAQHAAEMAMTGYKWLHNMANKWVQVSEKKLNKLQDAGEINLNAMISYDYGKNMRAGDFFKEYNSQVSNLFVVDEEFEEKVTPLLTKICAKRGIGLSDEQTLMYYVVQDIIMKGMMFIQQKRTLNTMIDTIKEATMGINQPQRPQPQPQQQQYQPPPPQQEYESPIIEEDDFVKTTEKSEKSIKPDTIIMPRKRGRPAKENK